MFRNFVFSTCVLVFALSGHMQVARAENDEVKAYVFGHSLVYHKDPDQNVPFWLNQLANAAGKTLSLSGQFGFLNEHVQRGLPPRDKWRFRGVKSALRGGAGFENASLTSVIITPKNFAQYQPVLKFGEQSPGSLLGDTIYLMDWVEKRHKKTKFYIYGGWADMGAMKIGRSWKKVSSFPPKASMLQTYHDYNGAQYHDWYVDYVAQIKKRRPSLDVDLIPIARIMSKLYADTSLKVLEATDLYEDSAPHGTATTYFIAALVVYTKLYAIKAPQNYVPPANINKLVIENYGEVTKVICEELKLGAACN